MAWLFRLYAATVFFSLAGCSLQYGSPSGIPGDPAGAGNDPVATRPAVAATTREADPAGAEKQVIVFRGKYQHMTGPCVRIGDAIAMPKVDAFEVVEVVSGKLEATIVYVRPFSDHGPGYPKPLADGETYDLRLTPSQQTKAQLRDLEKPGSRSLFVDGDEIELRGPGGR